MAIRNIPTPKNVTDLWSLYALCHQVSNYYAISPKLHPLRELQKKAVRWYWDGILQDLFNKMKTVITDEVEKGVTLYDPRLPTAVLLDWCKTGRGYILAQKHCHCPGIDPTYCTRAD